MAGFAKGIDVIRQQATMFTTMRLMAGGALAIQHFGVAGVAKRNGVAGMAITTQGGGGFRQQVGIIAAVRDMTNRAISICDRVVLRLHLFRMTTGAVQYANGQFRHIFAVKIAVAFDTITAGNGCVYAGGIEMDVIVAFDAGLSHVWASHSGLMGRMASATCRQFVGGVRWIGESRIELIFVAGGAELGLGLDEVHGLVAAVPVVAKQTLARGHIGMGLVDGLAVILVAGITGFGLCLGQQGIIGRFVEGDVAFAATFILVRLVGMSQTFGTGQIVVTLSAGLGLNDYGLVARFVGIVAETALHVFIAGMRRRGDGWVELLFMAGATQFRLGVPQDGGIVGTMREMAEIAFFLGELRVRLHHRAAMIVMAGIARVGYGSHHQFGVCPRMRCVAIDALPILERLMPVRHR